MQCEYTGKYICMHTMNERETEKHREGYKTMLEMLCYPESLALALVLSHL